MNLTHRHGTARAATPLVAFTLALVGTAAGLAAAGPPAAFVVDWYTVDGGGGTSGGGGFQLDGTIGQPDAGVAIGGGFVLSGGFWAGGSPDPAPPCPEDLDGSGAVDFDDLLAVLATFGECDGCPSDFDVDGDVDFDDLLAVLAVFGPCPS